MATVRFTSWNASQIFLKVPAILASYGGAVAPMLQETIKSKAYDYPVTSVRKVGLYSGKIVPKGKRDIVDTGELLNSQTEPEIKGNKLTIKWTAPYSKAVLDGGYLVGTVRDWYEAPSRDWITPVLEAKPPGRFFVQEWQKLGK
jgi:hypothetical protein